MLRALIEPGFFGSHNIQLALIAGAAVAVAASVAGVFTVIRGQAFAGEALGDIGVAGGSGASLIGLGALWGFLAAALVGTGAMELVGVQRPRGRDVATGIVLGVGFGLAALLLYLNTTSNSVGGTTITVLFGSILALRSSDLTLILVLAAIVLAMLAALYRPLLLASASAELAAVKGIRVRLIGALYLWAVAVVVALTCETVGAILSTALLIGPAATGLRIARTPRGALITAAATGIVVVWLGVLLAYDSYYWPHPGWPVSFFVVALTLIAYALANLIARIAGDR